MKREIFYGTMAVIAMIVATHAQNMNNGYFSSALAFFFPPFLRNVASQSYPLNNPDQVQGIDLNSYYSGRWNRPQQTQNPFFDQYNRQYGRNYGMPALPKVTRLGEKDAKRVDAPTDTRNVQITSRIAAQDDVQLTDSALNQNVNTVNPTVTPLYRVTNVDTRFANSRPDNELVANPDSITFRDRQAEVQGNSVASDASVALTGFGLTLMKLLSAEQVDNPVISPYSVAELLALLQQGAAGNSESEITQALSMTPMTAKEAFRALLNSVKSRSTRNVLKIATNVFVNNLFDLDRTFKNTAVQNFDSDVTPMNFNKASDSARQINSWVAEKTQHYIRELISPDMLESNTQMVLANAIFFKGLWHTKFDPRNTTSGDFHLGDGTVKRVEYMRARFGLPVGLDGPTGIVYAVMPFEGEQYKMMFLMSEQDDLKTTIDKLTTEKLLNFLMVKSKDVRVTIPKFTAASDMDLKAVMNKMGIREIFGFRSNLFNVGTYRSLSPQITSVLHKAVLSIDEQGGVAAAATAFPAVALSFGDSTINFELNKPFLTILWDADNRVPLFIARIDDPNA